MLDVPDGFPQWVPIRYKTVLIAYQLANKYRVFVIKSTVCDYSLSEYLSGGRLNHGELLLQTADTEVSSRPTIMDFEVNVLELKQIGKSSVVTAKQKARFGIKEVRP